MSRDKWVGLHVNVTNHVAHRSGKDIGIRMSLSGANRLALSIQRLQNTPQAVPPEVAELLQALNYVQIGDPVSVAYHRRMEAAKGMEPAAADPRSYVEGELIDLGLGPVTWSHEFGEE